MKELNTRPGGEYPSYGYGKQTVYIYYYESYRKIGMFMNMNYYPIKVGKTISLNERLRQQNAAMPEAPIIPFIIKTAWAIELEIMLHMILFYKQASRKWITDLSGGGKEWFLTNPEEILQIAKEYKQTGKGAKDILEEYNAYRTNWSSDLIDRFKHYFPEIKDPDPLDLLFKDVESRRKKYGQYKPPKIQKEKARRPLYTDYELDILKKNDPKEYNRIMKMYEKGKGEK